MGKKNDENLTDAAADFFGDDVDWLDDEDDDSGTLPVAPPPKAPAVGKAESAPASEPGWANRISEAPLDPKHMASAPTLTFSAVPTLPPGPAPKLDSDRAAGGGDSAAGGEDTPSAADEPTVEIPSLRGAKGPGGVPPIGKPAPMINTPAPVGRRSKSSRSAPKAAPPKPPAPPPEPEVEAEQAASGKKGRATPAPAAVRVTPAPVRRRAAAPRAATPEPASTSTPAPRAATPEPAPRAATPEPAPRAATPEPAPRAATPTPRAATPEPAPRAATPEPAPRAATPTPAPRAATPTPAPRAATPTPAPRAATPAPAPSAAASGETGLGGASGEASGKPTAPPGPPPVPAGIVAATPAFREPELVEPPTEDPASAATEEVFGDALEEGGQAAAPLVRTQEPSPAGGATPQVDSAPEADEPVGFTPPVGAERPLRERWTPPAEGQVWRDVATTMVAEAALASSEARGRLLFEAAEVYLTRLDDTSGAETLCRDAYTAGLRDPRLLADLARLARDGERFEEALGHLEERAALFEGPRRADVHLEAALLARDRLKRHDAAVENARRALEAEPDSYAGLSVMRDLLADRPDAAEERADVLGRLGAAGEGFLAAEAWVEQGRVLRELGRVEDAQRAYERALAACPSHTEAFLSAVSLLQDTGDHERLAVVYDQEAAREGQPDAGWWWLKAARAWAAAGQHAEADLRYGKALEAGFLFAERERQGAYTRNRSHAELAASLAREVELLEPAGGKAFAAYRLAWTREVDLDDAEGALAAYREALAADPSAHPAIDGALRTLRALKREAEIVPFLEERVAAVEDPALRSALRLQLAFRAEGAGDHERALAAWQALREEVGEEPEGEVLGRLATDGVERALAGLERWGDLAELYEQRAAEVDDAAEKARRLYRAATVGPRDVPDRERAVVMHERVLEVVADHRESLEALEGLLGSSDPARLGRRLRLASEAAMEPVRQAALDFRSARLLASAGVEDEAREAAERCLQQVAGFQPALTVLVEITPRGDLAAHADLYRRRADQCADPGARCWGLFAASQCAAAAREEGGASPEARADLRTILDIQPEHAGAVAALEVRCLADEDVTELVGLYDRALLGAPSADKARLSARVAELMHQLNRRDEAVHVLADLYAQDVEGRPLRAAARLAASLGAWEQAVNLLEQLESAEDRLERARILSRKLRQPRPALALLSALSTEQPEDLAIAINTARVAFQADDRSAMVAAQGRVAEHATAEAMRAAYAGWTASMLEAEGREDEALTFWRISLGARPEGLDAFDGVVRGLVSAGDADGLRASYQAHRPSDGPGLARALEAAGDLAGAAEVLREELGGADNELPVLLQLEQVLSRLEEWQGVYDVLVQRKEHTLDETQQAAIDAKRRWLLAEKLADTDAAWDLYRELHDEDPGDREVTEALARIAGARGETGLAIQYLEALVEGTKVPEEAARYQRRIGEVYESAGDRASARQAYLDALDHVPDDQAALDGLKRLAEQEEDWGGLIAVLQREAGLADAARRLELRREIARVTQERLGDPAVAMDAWRAVIEEAPQDIEALEQMLELAEAQSEWGVFVETGKVLAALRSGAERSALLRRVGVVCQDQLERDDAIRYFEQAIAGDQPDLEAAGRLEELFRARADWNGTIRALGVQADAARTPEDKVAALLRAARVELETRHDREAAAVFYGRILEVDADHEPALRFMASHLFEAGRFDEALPVCERLEPLVEKDQDLDDFDTRMELSTFYFYFAELLRLGGDGDKALPRYERALTLNPTHLASLEAVGPLYTEVAQWKKAEKVYRQLLQLSGGQGDRHKVASTYTALGLVERQLGNGEKAYKRFNKALEIFPNHVGALKGRALILEDREEWNSLLNIYNNIIYHATVPQDVIDAYMTKGRILDDRMARPDKAAQHYQRSLDFDADQPRAHLRLAELAMRRDAYEEAGKHAARGLELQGEDADAARPLLLLCAAAAEKDAARTEQAEERLAEARVLAKELTDELAPKPFADLEALRQFIKDRLPN